MRFLLVAGLLAGMAANAAAWGGKGHRIVASLAEKRLRSAPGHTMDKIAELLGPGSSLVSVAVCADSIRGYVSNRNKPGAVFPVGCIVTKEEAVAMFPSSGSWHYVNIPVPATAAKPNAHPKHVLEQACAKGDPCILKQIDHFTSQLKNKKLDRQTRAIALMFIVHLIGDLHQPLHAVARENDRGGNEVFVKMGSYTDRLHTLWDTYLLNPIDEAQVEGVSSPTKGSPSTWAWESYDAARDVVYKDVPLRETTAENPIVLADPEYREAATRVIVQRLRSASVRLADVLVEALGR